jgi:hypothetical protein
VSWRCNFVHVGEEPDTIRSVGKVEDPTALPLCIIVLRETTPCVYVDTEV